ncbi:hypothetical protein MLD38_008744 [Melastoma candidum]|uniref:Uncharacterized protein n=1 Tax=Melastoma candidum TaxID=119954 RepID=A0ACB9RWL7_9MYRT|nr:hypothetical protein MLD38_008744 [Melastoma candidum]
MSSPYVQSRNNSPSAAAAAAASGSSSRLVFFGSGGGGNSISGGNSGSGVFGVSRLRSSSAKKPPEPLRRAVADCLSSSSAHYVSPSASSGSSSSTVSAFEASRTLRDYLASPATTDLAYTVIIEHTIAERERSPAVVTRCVTLLKRYLLRYRPSEETLQQIDRFCLSFITECDVISSKRTVSWSGSSSQSIPSSMPTNVVPLPVSTFASASLIKSLYYIRSLVAQHVPKRSFQAAAFAGAASASKQMLPSLSSLLKRSFNSQLSPKTAGESLEGKDDASVAVMKQSSLRVSDLVEDLAYIAQDVLKWRLLGERLLSGTSLESDRAVSSQDTSTHNFLEVGAAALLVGDMEAKIKGQHWKYFGTADMPYLDQLLQPSPTTTITNSASARPHLRAITASKRSKREPHQIWGDSPVSTFRPRARPLFQYRHYSEQQPLRLNPAEVSEVIAAVCSDESAGNANVMTVSRLNNGGRPTMDVAVSVLVKLIIDMYVLDPGSAAPLTLSMLQEMLCSSRVECRSRSFDLVLNLGVHAHLLEPVNMDVTCTIKEEYAQEPYVSGEPEETLGATRDSFDDRIFSSAIDDLEIWILNILYEILLFLVQIEEEEESVWASGLSCLLYFVCDRGKIWRNRLIGLDIRVIKSLLEISRRYYWAEIVHSKLTSILTNMFYELPERPDSVSTSYFLVNQVDLIGGIEFIFLEYSLANSREERRNLYMVLFDYVLHQINETCLTTGVSDYSDDEIKPLAILLILADAPEAFYISVKLGVQGIGEILRRSISDALDRYPNSERLNMLLESITERFDVLVSSFTHLDIEFSHMIQITKSFKDLQSIGDTSLRLGVGAKVNLYWSCLHSLLRSENISCRRNGYIWLGDLLISEISEEKNGDIWYNITNFKQRITVAGTAISSAAPDVPLPIWLMCGLLKSKHSRIRWGFLLVLERLLMRCKFLLDEKEMQIFSSIDHAHMDEDIRLKKANAIIDIMSSALSLVCQMHEADRMNILKMCDILFSQLYLKVPPPSSATLGDGTHLISESKRFNAGEPPILPETRLQSEHVEDSASRGSDNSYAHCGTASMAALLLQGRAVVPMQLVARVPADLFYWPLFQLASAATDNIALGVAVGSKGRGNLPGAGSDIRATLLLLLIGKCTADPSAFQEFGGEELFRGLLDDTDSRVAYYSSAFLLKRMMSEKPEKYQLMLQNLVFKAQQSNNEKLLENPYLQMRGILQLANDLGVEL